MSAKINDKKLSEMKEAMLKAGMGDFLVEKLVSDASCKWTCGESCENGCSKCCSSGSANRD